MTFVTAFAYLPLAALAGGACVWILLIAQDRKRGRQIDEKKGE